MKITIEYCVQWNYLPRASGLEDEIKRNFDTEVELVKGSGGVFEVCMNDKTIFSKSQEGRFPTPEEIVSILRQSLFSANP